ncbi:MAG: CTP synthase, partial [Bdellovibrio sp.]
KARMFQVAQGAEVTIIEIGGTVGDIESLPFLEAIRQMRLELGLGNSVLVHVTYLPYIATAGELKSKPTQHSVKELREIGLQPDFLICRSEKGIETSMKKKIGLFCSVPSEHVIAAPDSQFIYEVPLALHREKLDDRIVSSLGMKLTTPDLKGWDNVVKSLQYASKRVRIAIVGKYVDLKESYKSLHEALVHGGIANHAHLELQYLDSEKLNEKNLQKALEACDGILVPGGFGSRGVEGKMLAIRYARENQIPFFGICYGMQLAAIEFARNVCGIRDATSREWVEERQNKGNFVIDVMEDQKDLKTKGGNMRLGAYACEISPHSKSYQIYKSKKIFERHRHRYEFNSQYKALFEKRGMNCVGINPERDLVEVIELVDHPWFIGVQFHPEFKSKPLKPHPLFVHFIRSSLKRAEILSGKKRSVHDQPTARA